MTEPAPRRSRLISLEVLGLAVAILSLAAALIYNGRQLHQTREATQLQLMTNLNAQLNDSMARLWKHENEMIAIQTGEREFASSSAKLDIDRAFAYMEYLAWLFDAKFLDLPDAEKLWAPSMACRYENVLLPTSASADDAAHDYPHLTRLVRAYRPCKE